MKLSILPECMILALAMTMAGCSKKEAKLHIDFSDKYEGQTVELMNYADSTVIASSQIVDGKADFTIREKELDTPVFANIQVDGRIRAFYIIEPGNATLNDTISVAQGTPMNDRFTRMLADLDSVENLDDMNQYVAFVEKSYNDNKATPMGVYFCIEWLKYAEPLKVDSFLNTLDKDLQNTKRIEYYRNFARHRGQTSSGMPYADLEGETIEGSRVNMSKYIKKGGYTLVDFWASWCPYCIKEMPDLKTLYSDYKDKGLEIVGVAVRDKPEDTKLAVEKYDITWPVLYNTQRNPYDVYGFSGIPHHILIGPDGKILSRGENIKAIRNYLEETLK